MKINSRSGYSANLCTLPVVNVRWFVAPSRIGFVIFETRAGERKVNRN
jgi:hypothetical protein